MTAQPGTLVLQHSALLRVSQDSCVVRARACPICSRYLKLCTLKFVDGVMMVLNGVMMVLNGVLWCTQWKIGPSGCNCKSSLVSNRTVLTAGDCGWGCEKKRRTFACTRSANNCMCATPPAPTPADGLSAPTAAVAEKFLLKAVCFDFP